MQTRIDWIDPLKGIGILAVVIGHISTGYIQVWLYLFHMPLFYFISGYLFKPSTQIRQFFYKKVLNLLLPYLIFLMLFSAREILPLMINGQYIQSVKTFLKFLWGGRLLTGWTSVFWFITCLFVTQQVFNILLNKFTPKMVCILMFICLIFSYLGSLLFLEFHLPWSLEVTLAALPFFACGYYIRQANVSFQLPLAPAAAFLIIGLSGLLIFVRPDAAYDMKYAKHGIPFLSFIAALAVIFSLIQIATLICRLPLLKQGLSVAGSASLVIMYLHQPLQIMIKHHSPLLSQEWTRIALSILISILSYRFLMKYAISRALCLGSHQDIKTLTGKLI
jgi:polysaccharide biosynthesis protein PslL